LHVLHEVAFVVDFDMPECLRASQTMLPLAHLGGPARTTQKSSGTSAISSELRAMAAKGQLGNNLGSAAYREQIKKLYESVNFVPL
jgi:hypothetical protein